MKKKGFLFTFMAMVFISFMIYSIYLWSESINEKESIYPVKIKTQNLILFFNSINEEAISSFANMSSFYAINYLVNYTLTDPNSGLHSNENIQGVLENLMYNGTSNLMGIPDDINYSNSSKSKYTFISLKNNLNSTCSKIGLECNLGEFEDFYFNQTDFFQLSYGFNISLNVSDRFNNINLTKKIPVNGTIDLYGFRDPFSRYYVENDTLTNITMIQKQIFYNKSNIMNITELAPEKIIDGHTIGSGWFYGPVTGSYCAGEECNNRNVCDAVIDNSPSSKFILKLDIIGAVNQTEINCINRFGAVFINYPVDSVKSFRNLDNDTQVACNGIYNGNFCSTTHSYSRTGFEIKEKNTINPIHFLNRSVTISITHSPAGIPYCCDPIPPAPADEWDEGTIIYNEPKLSQDWGEGTGLIIRIPYFHRNITMEGVNNITQAPINPDQNDSNRAVHYLFVTNNKGEDPIPNLEDFINNNEEKYTNYQIYDIENLRDAYICMNYYTAQNNSPNYLVRLKNNSYNINGLEDSEKEFGIVSFVSGMHFGGSYCYDQNKILKLDSNAGYHGDDCITFSRLDYEYISQELVSPLLLDGGTIIRGLLACKNYETCSLNVTTNKLGRFYLTKNALDLITENETLISYGNSVFCTDMSVGIGSINWIDCHED